MFRCLISAPASGSGKTAVTCGLLALLKNKGYAPCACKCGPDYIDPMFHRAVMGVESHNLDLFLSDETFVRRHFAHCRDGHDAVICEGAMGLYDGVGGTTTQASAWHVADTLHLPVLLVVRPKGASLTLAAQIRGLAQFRSPCSVAGVVLNDCSAMLYRSLAPMLERETGIPVLGFLPHMEQAQFESRHLGLYTAEEIGDLTEKIAAIADELEQHLDWERLTQLCDSPWEETHTQTPAQPPHLRLAVAQDEAFCFRYAETMEALAQAGVEPVPFSPMRERALPADIDGLYLCGGYPELHAEALSGNGPMREAIAQAVRSGLPTVAECGGFLYLGQSLAGADGKQYPMAGVLRGTAEKKSRLVRFGYAQLTAKTDGLLLRKGETVPVHEFHYWDSTENGADFHAEKPVSRRAWDCGISTPTLYAGFPHLYFAGHPKLIARWVSAMEKYHESK